MDQWGGATIYIYIHTYCTYIYTCCILDICTLCTHIPVYLFGVVALGH